VLKESHELGFQEKLASSGGLDIQASKKIFAAKGKGKKTTPLKTIEVPHYMNSIIIFVDKFFS